MIWYPASSSHAKIYITLQWNGLSKSRKKLNTLYLYLQKAHENQTRQGADWLWEVPAIETTWSIWSLDQCEIFISNFHKSYGY